jgi:hypothetical protein
MAAAPRPDLRPYLPATAGPGRQEWLALLPEPVIPAVIGPDGAVHGGPDGLCCLAGIADPGRPELASRAVPGDGPDRELRK